MNVDNSRVSGYTGKFFVEFESSKVGFENGHAAIGDGAYTIEAKNPSEGIVRVNAKQRIEEHWKKRNGKIYGVSFPGITNWHRNSATEWAKLQVKKGYDTNPATDSAYYCSELVNKAWQSIGYGLINGPSLYLPLDLTYSGRSYFIVDIADIK